MTTVALLGGGKLARAALTLLRAANVDVVASVRAAAQAHSLEAAGARIAPAREAVASADVVFFAVPAPALGAVVDVVTGVARAEQVVLHASRGTGEDGALPHEIIRRSSCWKKIAVLGGPLYVDDAVAGRQLAAAVASRFDEVIRVVRALTKGTVRVSSTRDVIGVEVAGALSNVGHVAAGLAAGAGFGETDQSLLHVRALLEGARLGVHLGADRNTFNGLAGLGDLIPRNVTSTRLHKKAGEDFVAGIAHDKAAGMEGLVTARAVAALGVRHHLDLPLVRAVDDIFAGRADVTAAIEQVLALDLGLQAA